MSRTRSSICSTASGGGLMTTSTPSPRTVSSKSVTSAETSMRASRARLNPVISQSIHTSRSFTRPTLLASALDRGPRFARVKLTSWLGVAARLVAGGVWIAAGYLKIGDPAASVRAVRAYDLLPESIVPLVGYALPVVETVVGLCLVVGLVTRWAALVSSLLL